MSANEKAFEIPGLVSMSEQDAKKANGGFWGIDRAMYWALYAEADAQYIIESKNNLTGHAPD